jgi:long-chain acyl-CoA synthetase
MKSIYEEKPWIKYYPEGVPSEVEIISRSLSDAFEESVGRWQKKDAIVFYGRNMNYLELKEEVDRFATALYDLGIRKGDTVAILLLNSPQFIIAYYAVFKLGAMATLINPMYVSPEIKNQIENSQAKDIVCLNIFFKNVAKTGIEFRNVILSDMGDYLPKYKKLLGKSPLSAIYKKMALPSPKIYEAKGFYEMSKLIGKYPPNPHKITIIPEEDIATLQYTGGTTGLPKGAMLTHYNYLANEAQYNAFLRPILTDGKEIIAAYMPFYHAAAQVYLINGLLRGYTLVIASTTDLDDILRDIEKYGVTVFIGAPTMFDLLKDYEKTNRVNWKKLNLILSGADALHEDTTKGWERRTGVKIVEAYGMSEAVAATHCNPNNRIKVGSFGIPLPSMMSAIIHSEEDKFIDMGEIGEIGIKGPSVMKGYWRDEKETQMKFANINGELWMRTGDLGKMDDEGYFYFFDRKKDMIKYKGHAVFAREVEEIIKNHPNVKDAGVVGVPDQKSGELIKAVVVLENDARGKLTEEDIVKYCEEKLSHFKIPKIVEFRGEIPKTDVGKVSRRELREE